MATKPPDRPTIREAVAGVTVIWTTIGELGKLVFRHTDAAGVCKTGKVHKRVETAVSCENNSLQISWKRAKAGGPVKDA